MYNRRPPMPLKASLKRPTKQLPRPTRLSPVRRPHHRAQHHRLKVVLKIVGRGGVERARQSRAQPLPAALPARLNRQIPRPVARAPLARLKRAPAARPLLHRVQLNQAPLPQVGQPLAHHLQAPPRQSRPATSHRRGPHRPLATKATARAVVAKAEAVKVAASRLPW